MRYFKAQAYMSNSDYNRDWYSQSLFEELDKEALVFVDESNGRSYNSYAPWDDSGEARVLHLTVYYLAWNCSIDDIKKVVKKAIGKLGCEKVDKIEAQECSYLGHIYEDIGYMTERNIVSKLNLAELRDFSRMRDVFFDWNIKTTYDDKQIYELASKSVHSTDLKKELDRIYKIPLTVKDFEKGIPVHYIVEGSDKARFRESVDILLDALKDCNRVLSDHVFHINFDKCSSDFGSPRHFSNDEEMLASINENFLNALAGNTIIVEYGLNDSENDCDMVAYTAFKKFISLLDDHKRYTPIIFAVPAGKIDVVKKIRKSFHSPLVELTLDPKMNASEQSYDEVLEYILKRAKDLKYSPDANLRRMLRISMEDASFDDADALLEDWHNEKLIEKRFPLYTPELRRSKITRRDTSLDAMKQLDELIGLDSVKKKIREILNRYKMNDELRKSGLPVQEFSKHMVFLGAPGTGKTEVAKLYGQILKDAGVLPEGRVISVSGSQGFHVKETFDLAKGSVLFVDEAYGMTSPFGADITSFIALMEERRDDTIVILAGYKSEMEQLLNSNPGFRSRIGFTLHFPDYTSDELFKIFLLMCNRANLVLGENTKNEARDYLAKAGRRADQGNARYVRKFFEDCIGAQQNRLGNLTKKKGHKYTEKELLEILPEDLNIVKEPERKNARKDLDRLIGLKTVKDLVKERINFMRMQKIRKDQNLSTQFIPMHMAFTGNPGTGKTEVARLIGRILKEEGILSVGDVIECDQRDFIGGDPGVATMLVDGLFKKARGSVIFIDEAYTLSLGGKDGPNAEAVTAIINNMENLRDEVVVIFAGYTKEIEKLINMNPGFKSRVKTIIEFPDYSTSELLRIFKFMAKEQGYKVHKNADEKIKEIININRKKENFGNARFCRNLLEIAITKQSSRLITIYDDTKKEISENDMRVLISQDFEIEELNRSVVKNNIGFG